MTIERQVEDALSDFNGLVADGWDVSKAVYEAAVSHGLKPDVFEKRLSRAMPLDMLAKRIHHDADRQRTYEVIYGAVAAYFSNGVKWFKHFNLVRIEVLEWVEQALGRPPTSEEQAQADRAYREIKDELSAKFQRDFARYLRENPIRPADAKN